MANPRSKAKIEARILERVAYCVEFELNDPRSSFITITKVEVSNDLSSAKILYSVLGGESERSRVAHMLERASGFIRGQVGRVLKTRSIPKLRWYYDDSIEYAAEVEEKIAEALRKDRKINPEAHAEKGDLDIAEDEAAEVEREYGEFLEAEDGEV